MAQEGAQWPSVMISIGPHWCNSKITWANIDDAQLDVGTKITISGLSKMVDNPTLPDSFHLWILV